MGRRGEPKAAMLILLILAFTSVALVSTVESKTNYLGWKVVEVLLEGDEDGEIDATVNKLHDMEDPSYLNILRTARDRGMAEVAVSPEALKDLRQQQQENQISFSTVVHDLGKKLESDPAHLRIDTLARGAVTYERYMTTDEILTHLEELPKQFPDKLSLRKVGDSVENRPLYLITISSRTKKDINKPVIFIDGGIHAREWISPVAALNIIERLLESPSLTRNIEWQIMPLLNPDGYEYSWTNDRLWRKNRATGSRRCTGTDLNRNFGYHWGESGASKNPCSTIYRGPSAFSEPESIALRDALLQVKDRTQAYITIHSYGQYILYPWGYTTSRDRYNDEQLFSVGEGMANAIKRNDGTVFTVGSAAKLLYPAAGASDDWAAGEAKIPLVYTLELRDEGAGGFVLPAHLIRPAVYDAWLAVKYLSKQVIKKEGLKLHLHSATAPAEPRTRQPTETETPVTQPMETETPVTQPMEIETPVTQPTETETPVTQATIVESGQYRDSIYREPVQTRPIYRIPVYTRPTYRNPTYSERYYGSSEEDSSSEESSEESDEYRK